MFWYNIIFSIFDNYLLYDVNKQVSFHFFSCYSVGSHLVRNMSTEAGTGKSTNRLILEKSPYLLQHATNPVDWYPWGEEAFEKAKTENKLIFLSVGYSTCHWYVVL